MAVKLQPQSDVRSKQLRSAYAAVALHSVVLPTVLIPLTLFSSCIEGPKNMLDNYKKRLIGLGDAALRAMREDYLGLCRV